MTGFWTVAPHHSRNRLRDRTEASVNQNELVRERAQDTLDLFEDLMASTEKVGTSLKHSLLDLRRDGTSSDMLPMLRAKRQADRLRALAASIEHATAPVRRLEAAE